MGHRLGAVDDNGGSVLVSHIDHELDGIHGAQGVRDMPERHQLGAAGKQLFVSFEPQLACIGDRHDPQRCTGLGTEDLPGDDVGMMFHPGDDHLIAWSHVLPSEAVGRQIDRLGRAADEDHLPW